MAQPEIDPWLQGLVYTLAAASLATWLALVVRRTEKPFLRYEPRRPVPWGPGAAGLAMFFVVMPIILALTGDTVPPRQEMTHPARQIAVYILEQGLITGLFLAAVIAFSGATVSDLGLPTTARQLGRGIAIGLVAWLAALLPVQGVQAILFSLLEQPSHHPLVQLVIEEPSPALMVVAFLAAVVIAPICEEVMFRLLLQGWLEKWEDEQLGWRTAAHTVAWPEDVAAVDGREALFDTEPPRRGLAGLPYGWGPILMGAGLFGLAHFGHGTDPIPLFLLGIILGYTYQRTHCITACIVTHMAFNLLSMIVLWSVVGM